MIISTLQEWATKKTSLRKQIQIQVAGNSNYSPSKTCVEFATNNTQAVKMEENFKNIIKKRKYNAKDKNAETTKTKKVKKSIITIKTKI
jgi:hypothetical protein